MAEFRVRVTDSFNPWFKAIVVEGADQAEALRRADHMLFARRETGRDVQVEVETSA
jgi:hypothetical protein